MRLSITFMAFVCTMTICTAPAEAAQPIAIASTYLAPDVPQAETCGRIRDWAARSFNDSKAVIEVYDPQRGKIIGKGSTSVAGPLGVKQRIGFVFEAKCRDGSVSTKFDQVTLIIDPRYGGGSLRLHDSPSQTLYEAATQALRELDASIAAAVRED